MVNTKAVVVDRDAGVNPASSAGSVSGTARRPRVRVAVGDQRLAGANRLAHLIVTSIAQPVRSPIPQA